MSGGMRQRLALIRAFAYPSEILLMDEPFKALDKTLKDSIIETFLNLYKENKRTVLFVTHDIEEAKKTGDIIYEYSNKPMKLISKISL
jgi:NitT/TauT family transport system ATP-binding protein